MKELIKNINRISEKLTSTIKSAIAILIFSRIRSEKLQESKNNRALILACGPSLKNDIDEITSNLNKTKNTTVWAVNNFFKSKKFEELKPEYYLISDYSYWKPAEHTNKEYLGEELHKEMNKVFWKMNLLVPRTAIKSKLIEKIKTNTMIKIIPYNLTPIEGFDWFVDLACNFGAGIPKPTNTLIVGITLAISSKNYKKIFIAGADHSWHEQIKISAQEATLSQNHFYEENCKALPMYKYSGKKFTMSEIFSEWANNFRQYEILNRIARKRKIKIYNISSHTYIDAFERKKINEISK